MNELRTGSNLMPAARKEGDAVVASVRGEIDLHNSPELRTEILSLLAEHAPRRLVLNLAEVPYMDSSAIAVLVEAMQKLRKSSGRVCLTNLQPRVKSLLDIAKLGSIFLIAKDEQEALRGSECVMEWLSDGVEDSSTPAAQRLSSLHHSATQQLHHSHSAECRTAVPSPARSPPSARRRSTCWSSSADWATCCSTPARPRGAG
jgi:anti-sigma B factor antagonist